MTTMLSFALCVMIHWVLKEYSIRELLRHSCGINTWTAEYVKQSKSRKTKIQNLIKKKGWQVVRQRDVDRSWRIISSFIVPSARRMCVSGIGSVTFMSVVLKKKLPIRSKTSDSLSEKRAKTKRMKKIHQRLNKNLSAFLINLNQMMTRKIRKIKMPKISSFVQI